MAVLNVNNVKGFFLMNFVLSLTKLKNYMARFNVIVTIVFEKLRIMYKEF